MFDDLVCPLFGNYSRVLQALQGLSEDDPRHHNVSVLVFVVERQVESLCERVSHHQSQHISVALLCTHAIYSS